MFQEPKTLWTPDGVEYIQSWEVLPDYVTEDGERVFKHEFRLTYKGEVEMFGVMGESGTSDQQIEDIAAKTAERSMVKIIERLQARGSKLVPERLAGAPHAEVRKELAAIFRDYIASAKRRNDSSTGKRYFSGIIT